MMKVLTLLFAATLSAVIAPAVACGTSSNPYNTDCSSSAPPKSGAHDHSTKPPAPAPVTQTVVGKPVGVVKLDTSAEAAAKAEAQAKAGANAQVGDTVVKTGPASTTSGPAITKGGTVGDTVGGKASGGTVGDTSVKLATTGGNAQGGDASTTSGSAITKGGTVGNTVGGKASGGTVGDTTVKTGPASTTSGPAITKGGTADGASVSGAVKGSVDLSGSTGGEANGNTVVINLGATLPDNGGQAVDPNAPPSQQQTQEQMQQQRQSQTGGGATVNTQTTYRNLTFTPMPVAPLPPVQVGGGVQVIDQGVCGPRRYMLETFDPESRESVFFGLWRTGVSYKTLVGKVGPFRAGAPGKQKAPKFENGKAQGIPDDEDDLSFIVNEIVIPNPVKPKGDPLYTRIDYIGHQVTTVAVTLTNGGGSGLTLNVVGSESAKAGGLTGNSANGLSQIGQVVRECVMASYEGKPTPKEEPPKVVEKVTQFVNPCDLLPESDPERLTLCEPTGAGGQEQVNIPLTVVTEKQGQKPRTFRVVKDPKFCDKNPEACTTVTRGGETTTRTTLKVECTAPKTDAQKALCHGEQGDNPLLKKQPWYSDYLKSLQPPEKK
jgi:hypothetical protein